MGDAFDHRVAAGSSECASGAFHRDDLQPSSAWYNPDVVNRSPRDDVKPRRLSISILLACLLAVSSCKTVPNVSPPPIVVPDGLSYNDVERAILMAVTDSATSPASPTSPLAPSQKVTVNVQKTFIGSNIGSNEDGSNRDWYFEDRKPGVVYLGYQRGALYMRVEARFDTESITLSIIDSRNLDQSGSRIHHGAFARLSNLEVEIRRSLGEVVRQGLDPTAP